MNAHISSLIEWFRAKMSRKSEDSEVSARHWKTAVFIFAFLLVAVIVIAVVLFLSALSREAADAIGIGKRAGIFTESEVEKALSDYTAKKKKFKHMLANPPSFVDPSR